MPTNAEDSKLVTSACDDIMTNISRLSASADPQQVSDAFTGPIAKAFRGCSDKNYLYRQLALKMHTDKKDSKILIQLAKTHPQSLSIPMQELERLYKLDNQPNLFDLYNKPDTDLYNFMEKILVDVTKQWNDMKYQYTDYQRYSEPFGSTARAAVQLLHSTILPEMLGVIIYLVNIEFFILSTVLSVYNPNKVEWIDALTQGAYSEEFTLRSTKEKMVDFSKKRLISLYPEMELDQDKDDELFELYARITSNRNHSKTLSPEKIKQIIITDMQNKAYGLEHLGIVGLAFCKALTKSNPKKWSDMPAAVGLRLAQFIFMIPVLIIEATAPLMLDVIINILLLQSLRLLFFVLCLAINSPLYIYDGLSAAINMTGSILENIFSAMAGNFNPRPETSGLTLTN